VPDEHEERLFQVVFLPQALLVALKDELLLVIGKQVVASIMLCKDACGPTGIEPE